jgi:hypothetical protein
MLTSWIQAKQTRDVSLKTHDGHHAQIEGIKATAPPTKKRARDGGPAKFVSL